MANSLAFDVNGWAEMEFRGAVLGDPRRTKRLIKLAARAANHPDGKLTSVCAGAPAELEGAYRLIGNGSFANEEVSRSIHEATARRCSGVPFVYVPVDGSSLHIVDRERSKGLGIIGTRRKKARGLKVMTGIAVLPNGTPVGIIGQQFWTRAERRRRKLAQKRGIEDKETRHWLSVMDQAEQAVSHVGVQTRLWYQLDREGDFWQMLKRAQNSENWLTVRSKADRRVVGGSSLSQELRRAPIVGTFDLDVPASYGRQARRATFELRCADVVLDAKDAWSNQRHGVSVTVVRALEIGTTPPGEAPLEWRLLTTRPIHTYDDIMEVVHGYALRWRVEEFHKTWKSGACNAEDTQLGTASSITRWCIILAAVAMRIERLKYLARNEPQTPATVELTRDEIDAAILLRKPKGKKRGDDATMEEVVRWIADIGGFTGKSSGGPPGTVVIGRGLEKIETAVAVLSGLGEKM